LRAHVRAHLSPLIRLEEARFEGAARGLAFQLVEGLGIVPREQVAEMVAELSRADRAKLHRLGVRLGYRDVFLPGLLRPARLSVRARLWRLAHPRGAHPATPDAGRVTITLAGALPGAAAANAYLAASGYRPVGDMAVRADILDRLAQLAHAANQGAPFEASHEMLSLLGRGRAGLDNVLRDLGYGGEGDIETRRYHFRHPPNHRMARGNGRKNEAKKPDSPASAFAGLRHLLRRA
jgi:ATP-dependent RNA helicase SUPV3L1/SUV3